MDFTAIDFETANGFRGSPCAVGLSKVRGGVVVEEASWLMRPPENHDRFDHHNVRIHGIRPEQVAGLPRFGELFPEIGAFIGGDVLAAHNAAFDLGVIRSGLEVSGLAGPAYDYVCTVMLSRRCYSLVSNSLPYAAEEAGVPLVNHHDAAEDARACAGILIDIAARNGAGSIAELYLSLGLAVSRQPAFDPLRDPLSKASQSALDALAGGAAAASLRSGPTSRAGRRKAPTRCRTPSPSPDTRCSARPWCSPANSPYPGPRPRSVPPSSAPGRRAGSRPAPPSWWWATGSWPPTCAPAASPARPGACWSCMSGASGSRSCPKANSCRWWAATSASAAIA